MSQAVTMSGIGARVAAVASFGAMEMAELHAALTVLGFSPDGAHTRRGAAHADDGERVPAALALQWLADAARTLDDPLIGLNAAAQGRPRGALVHLIMSAASLRDALGYVGRFSRLLIDALEIRLVSGAGECALVFAFDDPALAASDQLVDYTLLATSRVLRAAVGESFQPVAVHVRHAAPPSLGQRYRDAFRCAVRFGAKHNALLFASAALDAVPTVANPLVARQMEQLASALAARDNGYTSCRQRVAAMLRAALAEGRLRDRASIARELAMSEATLNRRLAAEGSCFRAEREAVVWELADALLSNPALKLEAVARSVGFNDAAALTRALRRRSGCSTTEYRRRLLHDAAR